MASSSVAPGVNSMKIHENEVVAFLSHLEDCKISSLSREGMEIGSIPQEVNESFDSLDPTIPRSLKVRYLLLHTYEGLEANPRLFERWLEVLAEHGVPDDLLDRIKVRCSLASTPDSGEPIAKGEVDINSWGFQEKDIATLTEILADHSSQWQNIGLSLNLPQNALKEILSRIHIYSGKICLSKVLREWIVTRPKHAISPTVRNLKKALASKIVDLGIEAYKLEEKLYKYGVLPQPSTEADGQPSLLPPVTKKPRVLSHEPISPSLPKKPRIGSPPIEIIRQSRTVEVAEEKSTFLEVQVASKHEKAVCYQWIKDGYKLSDDSKCYLGTNKPILCINNAFLALKGLYTCRIKVSTESGITSIESMPIKLTVNVSCMATKLIDLYTQSKQPSDSWPPVTKNAYINLALIKQGSAYHCNTNELTRCTIQGTIDDIKNEKEHVEYEKAFSEYSKGGFFLIEGRPGSGKTTLVYKVAEDWANGKSFLKGAKLVFLISLRLLAKKAYKNMCDILNLFCHNEDMAKNTLSNIESNNGKGVCFIMDGLDEFTCKEREESIVFKLIHKQYLSQSMVIVASRPAATEELRPLSHTNLEVLGFLEKQIFEYVENYPFQSPRSSQKMKAYFARQPNILQMCYLPMHAAMVCFLYDKSKKELPSTETKIYKQFTRLTILRSLKRHDRNAKLSSLEELCPSNNNLFMKICQVAFEMTLSLKQVFEQEDLYTTSGVDEASLGLVTVDSTATLYGCQELWYTFVHLTFQEFLAAYHLSLLNEEGQMEMITTYGQKKHMLVVWKFFCGLINFKNQESKFESILKMHDNSLFHCQCAFESQQPGNCKYVILLNESGLVFKNHIFRASDFISIEYVISNTAPGFKKLTLQSCNISDCAESLAKSLKLCTNLQTLVLSGNNFGDDGMNTISNGLRRCSNLQSLQLDRNKISGSGIAFLVRGLLHCKKLRSLCLDHNDIGIHGALVLSDDYLRKSHGLELQILSLSSTKITGDGIKHLSSGLKHCMKLQTLLLRKNGIGGNSVSVLAGSLGQCNSLQTLDLHHNEIDNEGAVALAEDLKQCRHLAKLDLSSNRITDDGVKCLVPHLRLAVLHLSNDLRFAILGKGNSIGIEGSKAIAGNLKQYSDLTFLNLRGCSISGESAVAIAEGLRYCQSLQVLNLSYNNIDEVGAKGLVTKAFAVDPSCSHSLQMIDLGHNKIGNAGAKDIAESLKYCRSLETLCLEYNEIGDDGVEHLASNLFHCQHLKTLTLYNNVIADHGALALADGIKECKCLERFNINDNNIRGEGAVALAEYLMVDTMSLERNYIGKDGAEKLASAFKLHNQLVELCLQHNLIGDDGARSLAEGLLHCTSLEILKLDSNSIGDDGATDLADGIKYCIQLNEVYLDDNSISDSGAEFLADGLAQCSQLQTLSLNGNRICIAGVVAITKIASLDTLFLGRNFIGKDGSPAPINDFEVCPNLKFLYLDSNQIGGMCAQIIAELLQNCTNLEQLDLQNNNIVGSDAKALTMGLVHCTRLRTLLLSNNLISSDCAKDLGKGLTHCTSLESLRLDHNNISGGGAVDLAKSIKCLKELYLEDNNITDSGAKSLANGLAQCSQLQTLSLNGNKISMVGAVAITKLFNLDTLYLGHNALREDGTTTYDDDVKDHANFKVLKLDANQVGDECAKIITEVIKHCTSLKQLNLSNNNIQYSGSKNLAMGLKHCTNLEILRFGNNHIGDDGARSLADVIKCCTNLKMLFLQRNQIGKDGIKSIADGLCECANLEILHLEQNPISNSGMLSLVEGLKQCSNLRILCLEHCQIDIDGIHSLCSGLSTNCIKELHLQQNHIGDGGVKILAQHLNLFSKLWELSLQHNQISNSGANDLAKGLRHCSGLETLSLDHNQIGDEGIINLAKGLHHCRSLQTLYLHYNQVSDEGTKTFASSLNCYNSLQMLKMSANYVSITGALMLFESLKNCTSLRTLNLGYNSLRLKSGFGTDAFIHCRYLESLYLEHCEIDDDCAMALANGLGLCYALDKLSLEYNEIGHLGAKALSNSLQHCYNLRMLNLNSNKLGCEAMQALAEGLKHCTDLKILNLEHNKIGVDGSKSLVDVLEHCSTLQTLNLGYNRIDEVGIEALSDGLVFCYCLETLILEHNKIGDTCMKTLSDSLTSCFRLRTLSLEYNRVSDSGAIALAECFKCCYNLEELNFQSNRIGNTGVTALFEGLKHCPYLSTLNLKSNKIDSGGANCIVEAMKPFMNLKSIYLGDNEVNEENIDSSHIKFVEDEMEDIIEQSKGSNDARMLNFRHSRLDCKNVAALVLILEGSKNLQILNLESTNLNDEGTAILVGGLKHCTDHLHTLYLGMNNIGDDGARRLAKCLANFSNLHQLNLAQNRISDSGAKTLTDALKSHRKLQELNLERNRISNSVAAALIDDLKCCKNTFELSL